MKKYDFNQEISDKISYIKASENPLSAHVGIINVCGATWRHDVGNNEGYTKVTLRRI